MEQIWITFTFEGKEYRGYFRPMFGPPANVWYLTIDGRHWGELTYTSLFGWTFYNKDRPELHQLAEEFGEHMIIYYQ